MKIKVKKEGRKGMYLVEKEDIKEFIKSKNFEQIHNYPAPTGNIFVGADHSVKSVLEDIDKSERIAILIGSACANNMGHSLSVIINNKLEMFDIGEITEKDLDIIN